MAAISSAIPISLEMVALKRLPPQVFGIMISMEPAGAALVWLGLLCEHLCGAEWLAIGLVVVAFVGSAFMEQWKRQRALAAETSLQA